MIVKIGAMGPKAPLTIIYGLQYTYSISKQVPEPPQPRGRTDI